MVGDKWYQQTWAKIVGFVAATGVIGTLGTGVVNTVNHWNFYQTLPVRLDSIEVNIDNIENGDKKFYEFFDKKSSTFAVGFRVKKEKDEHTGKVVWVKQYRDWKGHLNNIFIDHEMSELYGTYQYYYIDRDTHEKVYCW
jgi:hypothetical protein